MTDLGKKYIVAALVPVLLMFGRSTASNDGIEPVRVSSTVIRSGSDLANGTIDTKILESYFDQVSYDNAVNLYSLPVGTETIDFDSNQVVLVAMGSGGFTIASGGVIDVGDYLELEIRLHSAGTGCATLPHVANPFFVLKVNSLKEVRTTERKVINSCG